MPLDPAQDPAVQGLKKAPLFNPQPDLDIPLPGSGIQGVVPEDRSQPSLTSIPGVQNVNPNNPTASRVPMDTNVQLAVLQESRQRQLVDSMARAQNSGDPNQANALKTLFDYNSGDLARTRAMMQPDPSQQANSYAISQGFKAPLPMNAGMGNNVFGTAAPASYPDPTSENPNPPANPPSMIPFGQNQNNYTPSQRMNMYPRQTSAIAASASMRDQAAQAAQRVGQAKLDESRAAQAEADRAGLARLQQVEASERIAALRSGAPTGKALENIDAERQQNSNAIVDLQDPSKFSMRDYHIPFLQNRTDAITNLQNRTAALNRTVNPGLSALGNTLGVKPVLPPAVAQMPVNGTYVDRGTGYTWGRHPDGSVWVNRGDGNWTLVSGR